MHISRQINALGKAVRTNVSRRSLIRSAAAGVVLSSGSSSPLLADDDNSDRARGAVPLPIPHFTDVSAAVGNPALPHFFFPGPVEGTAVPTDPTGAHPDGRDPSTITNFDGFIGQVDLTFSGTGKDLQTGAESPYDFHTDTRFIQGTFIGADERRHFGTFAFI